MEDRVVLDNRFVVAPGLADGMTTFSSLSAALTAPGLAAGDVIQIEPNSIPGDLTGAAVPTVANVTIQGDPLIGLSSIPEFTISETFNVTATATGLILRNVNVQFVKDGSFDTDAGASVSLIGSRFSDFTSTATSVISLSGTGNVVAGSQFVAGSTTIAGLVVLDPTANSANIIRGNSFFAAAISSAGAGGDLLSIAPGASLTSQDVIADNVFSGTATSYNMIHVRAAVGAVLTGLAIRDNTLEQRGSGSGAVFGIWVQTEVHGGVIQGNRITAEGSQAAGIVVSGGSTAGTTTNLVIDGNVISTPQGGGIFIVAGSTSTSLLDIKVQGNSLLHSQIGISIDGTAGGPLTGIDLGGGNDFRGYTSAATATTGAIVVTGTTAATIPAQNNLFAPGVTPSSVVSTNAPTAVDVSNPLTGNAAYVGALYTAVLGRVADTGNSSGAGAFVAALDAGVSRAAVASTIVYSAEALGLLVDRLYLQFLGRAPDASGRAAFVAYLRNGMTFEQAATLFVTSAEYTARQADNAAFIQSLYTKLLGRTGSTAEVNGWVAYLATNSRSAVASGFLGSVEFRSRVVNQLFGFNLSPVQTVASVVPNLLHRSSPPPTSDVAAWVNTGLPVLSLVVAFASGDEFFANG